MKTGIFVGALLLAASQGGYAAGGTQVQISGTVVDPPPCTLNGGNVIDVNFEKVGLNKADGRKLLKQIDYGLQCTGSGATQALQMQLSGEEGFAEDVLATSLTGLGIRFYQNGNPIRLRQWFKLSGPVGSMVLTAAPILDPKVTSQLGEFQSSATLMVAFQ